MLKKWFEKIQKDGLRQYLDSIGFKGGDVLDVGCGRGTYSELFGPNYIGIDKESKEIAHARENYKNSRFEVMNAARLNFPDNSFDLVFSIAVFHHLDDDDIVKTFSEVLRVTKKNGHILIVDLVLPKRMKFLAYPLFWLDKGARIRDFGRLTALLSDENIKLRFNSLNRFINIGAAIFEWQKA